MRAPSFASVGIRLAAPMLGWLAGVAWQLQARALPSAAVHGGLLALAATAALASIAVRQRSLASLVLSVVAAAASGYAVTGLQAASMLAEALPTAIEGSDVVVSGTVASLPQRGADGVRFRFEVDEASRRVDGETLPSRLAIGWYSGFHEDAALTGPQRELRAGQRWRFALRLRRPHGSQNPHGFDFELQLFEQGVRATGYVRDDPRPQLLEEGAGHPVERLRQRVRDAIEQGVPDRRAAGVLVALAVGDQGAIARDDWELFRNTGVAHLMSISGLHVTMFAWLAGAAIAWSWRRSARAMLMWPAASAGRWGGLAAAFAYALFSGWGVPSQRTIWMLMTVGVLQGLGSRWPWSLVLLTAAVVVTALDPWALMQAGFWLSFMAVGLLMASAPAVVQATPAVDPASPRWRRVLAALRRHAGEGLRTQLVATVGLAPLTLVIFQQLSLVGLLANLVAIPFVTLLVTPLALLGAFAPPLWGLGGLLMQALAAYLAALATIPGAVWTLPVAPWWAQVAGLVAAALLIAPLPWRARLLALPLALPLLLPPHALPAEGAFDLMAADIGQGSAILVRTRGHALLFDTGPTYSRDSDAGQRVLVPLLRAIGDERLDLLVLSHRDLDHVGGAKAVLASLSVASLSSSLEATHPLLASAPQPVRCVDGQRWRWDGVEFAMLRPVADDYDRGLKSNAMSCVLRIAGVERSVLLTGDLEREQELRLVAAHGGELRSDVLIVPHHGSKTSSSPLFLDAVRPRLAVVQVGYRNRFGHPAAEVVERYRRRGIALVSTPSCGAWSWPASGPPVGSCRRAEARRYWHLPDPAPGE